MEHKINEYRQEIKIDGIYRGRLVCPSPNGSPVFRLELNDTKAHEWVYWYGDEAYNIWINWC